MPIGHEIHFLDMENHLKKSGHPVYKQDDHLISKPGKLGQFLVCDKRSSVGLCMKDYKSLHALLMIAATLLYRHTAFDRLYY